MIDACLVELHPSSAFGTADPRAEENLSTSPLRHRANPLVASNACFWTTGKQKCPKTQPELESSTTSLSGRSAHHCMTCILILFPEVKIMFGLFYRLNVFPCNHHNMVVALVSALGFRMQIPISSPVLGDCVIFGLCNLNCTIAYLGTNWLRSITFKCAV